MMRISTANNTVGNNTVGVMRTDTSPASHGSQNALAASQQSQGNA